LLPLPLPLLSHSLARSVPPTLSLPQSKTPLSPPQSIKTPISPLNHDSSRLVSLCRTCPLSSGLLSSNRRLRSDFLDIVSIFYRVVMVDMARFRPILRLPNRPLSDLFATNNFTRFCISLRRFRYESELDDSSDDG